MKTKLKEYIDTIFADAERRSPHNEKLAELKEEMLRNLEEKYDDLIAAGRAPGAAYNIAITGVGDISDLLDSVSGADRTADNAETVPITHRESMTLTSEERERAERHRRRSAILTSIAVALYILCVVPCIIWDSVVSVVLMFMMVATATFLLIYNRMSRPKFGKDDAWEEDDDDDDDDDDGKLSERKSARRRSPVYGAVSGALWSLTVCVYLLVSFANGDWHITWMIFLIAAAIDNIIRAIFDLRR